MVPGVVALVPEPGLSDRAVTRDARSGADSMLVRTASRPITLSDSPARAHAAVTGHRRRSVVPQDRSLGGSVQADLRRERGSALESRQRKIHAQQVRATALAVRAAHTDVD